MTKAILLALLAVNISLLSGCTTLHQAAQNNDMVTAQKMISEGNNVNAKDADGVPPLVYAAFNGHTGMARMLIENGADVNGANNAGDTALIKSASKGNFELSQLLLEKGATADWKSATGFTPLILAADKNYIAIVQLLLGKGANVNSVNNEGTTSIIFAAVNGHIEVAKILIDKGADVHTPNSFGNTALMMAARSGSTKISQMLLEKGVDVNSKSKIGDTALLFAAAFGKTETALYLISQGADISLRNNTGKSALDLAQANSKTETYNAILAAQKNPVAPALNSQLMSELESLIKKNNIPGLRKFFDGHPNSLSSIKDAHIRLLFTGPAQFKIIDILEQLQSNTKDALIIARINSTSGPYKNFSNEELADLKKMRFSDEVVATMISVNTEYTKEQKRLSEQRPEVAKQVTQEAPPPQVAETSTPVECLKLVAAIKACDQTGGFMAMGCKVLARSQYACPIPIETLMH